MLWKLGLVLITASCTVSRASVHSSSGTLSDLIPWICLSPSLYNCKGFGLGHTWIWSSGFPYFPYFLQFQSAFGNKEFMIWATVSSWSCFCWLLYTASPSSAAKDIIYLTLILTIWWCPCVEYSLVLLELDVCYDQCVLLAKLLLAFALLHFVLPSPNLLVTPGVSWLPTFAFQSPMIQEKFIFGVSSQRSCRSSYNLSTSASLILMVGA